jgi:1-acyl-sn-glycerol-3-phosphate acyltransferase
MNTGRWKRLWFWFQSHIGGRWIAWITKRQLEVDGLDQVEATSRNRPLLLVANHRSLFDLYVVMSVLFDRLPGWRAINFPVRGRFFYQTPAGVFLNFIAAWWSMWPPFFHTVKKRRFDQWALAELVRLCREGPGQLVGFHPEGTRNKGPDPYALLPGQPGVGRLIREAHPQVVPVFVGGLTNRFWQMLSGNWRKRAPIRVRFGPPLALDEFLSLPDTAATYRLIADRVMAEIGALAAADQAMMRSRSLAE